MEIKEIRKKLGLTQSELAKILGLSTASRIAEYENRTRNPSLQTKVILYCLDKNILTAKKIKKIIIELKKINEK